MKCLMLNTDKWYQKLVHPKNCGTENSCCSAEQIIWEDNEGGFEPWRFQRDTTQYLYGMMLFNLTKVGIQGNFLWTQSKQGPNTSDQYPGKDWSFHKLNIELVQ